MLISGDSSQNPRQNSSMESNHESIIPWISSSSTRILEDLIPDILKWLPVKTVCRFRCVCESWKSLISSPFFINLHYSTTSSTTPAHLKPYLRRGDFRGRCHNDYALCRLQEDHLRRLLFFPFRFQFASGSNYDYNRFYYVDLIHGVVCLSYSLASRFDSNLFWNPATHTYVAVPPSNADLDDDSFENTIGFGYDRSENDFKVVRIWMRDYPPKDGCRSVSLVYEVYSARQGLWSKKMANNIQFCRTATFKGRFFNGSIHWIVENYDSSSFSVLVFDCELQEFTTMELPQPILHQDVNYMELLDYCGMLSVLVKLDDGIELWVMEEHGVATTWKKLYAISSDAELNSNAIDIYRSSYQKVAPYGPNEWIKFRWNDDLFDDILNYYVYDESMMLMDDTEAQSYTNEEIVHIDGSPPFSNQVSN